MTEVNDISKEIGVIQDILTQQDEGSQDRGEGHEEGDVGPPGPPHVAL